MAYETAFLPKATLQCNSFSTYSFVSLVYVTSSALAVEVSGACPTHPSHCQTCVKAHFIWTIPLAFMLPANSTMQYNEHIVCTYCELYCNNVFRISSAMTCYSCNALNKVCVWNICMGDVFDGTPEWPSTVSNLFGTGNRVVKSFLAYSLHSNVPPRFRILFRNWILPATVWKKLSATWYW